MVDFSNTKDRYILHVQGDLNDADYIELTCDDSDFSESMYIAMYKALKTLKSCGKSMYIRDLEDKEAKDEELGDGFDQFLFDQFIKSGLSKDDAYELVDCMYYFIPHYDMEHCHTIKDVKLYKFENKALYYYDNTKWKKVL